jgi:hypothetical protein
MRWILAAIVAVAAAAGVPATAAPSHSPYDYQFSRDEADKAMADFAKCVVSDARSRARAAAYVRAIPTGTAFHDAGARMATPDCVPRSFGTVRMQFDTQLFRAALFGALYQRDFGRGPPPPSFDAVQPLVIAAEFDGPDSAIPAEIVFARIVGDCVARADPAAAHRLVTTRVASADEKEALGAVVPRLAGCVAAGRRTTFSRSMLRGLLAEALYKLRQASAPAPREAAK